MSDGRSVALVGLMGSGKSTVATSLGDALGIAVADTDALIEEATGRSIAEIFATDGEAAFRELEVVALRAALDRRPCVVATGGGVVTTPAACTLLEEFDLVAFLDVSPAEAARRVGDDPARPLLADDALASLEKLSATRRDLYLRVADLVVDVDHEAPDTVVATIVGACGAIR